jgi:hypothetical protein
MSVAFNDQLVSGYAQAVAAGGPEGPSARAIVVQAAKSLLSVINSAMTNTGRNIKANQVKATLVAAGRSAATEVTRGRSQEARELHAWCKAVGDHLFGAGTVAPLQSEGQTYLPRPVAAVMERQDEVIGAAATLYLGGVPLQESALRAIGEVCRSHPDFEQITQFVRGELDGIYGAGSGADFLGILMGSVERLSDAYRTLNG